MFRERDRRHSQYPLNTHSLARLVTLRLTQSCLIAATMALGACVRSGRATPNARSDAPVLFRNALVVNPVSAQPIARASVLVMNGMIEAVGAEVVAPEGTRIIDARGRYLVPGLWDMHAHLAVSPPIGRAPEHYVGYGVLNLRDMGGFLDELEELRADIRAGRRVGPEIVMAGPTLNGEQSADFHKLISTPREASAVVDSLARRGVDFIKIHRATSRAAFEAVAEAARRNNLTFSGHVPLGMSWIEASRGGQRTIEHIQTIFENLRPNLKPQELDSLANLLLGPLGDEIFGELAKNGTYFDPTLIGYEVTIDRASAPVAAARRRVYAFGKSIVGKASHMNVKILAGTDVLERHGDMLLTELDRLVEAGLTPAQALAAGTSVAAEAALHPELGKIAVGSPASFLIVAANPMEDVSRLRQLEGVVLRGRLILAAELATLRQ